MPVALNFPDEGGESLRLQSGFHGPIRGSAGRRKALLEIGERDRNVEGVMHASLTCTWLWSLFWLQFVIGVPFNMPVIHTLAREGWFRPDVAFYIPCDGPLPFSIAGNFVFISLIASGLALVCGWLWTRGVKGRWRIRFAVLGFALLPSGWALAGLAAEDAAWKGIEREREVVAEELYMSSDMGYRSYLRRRLESIDRFLEMKPGNED